jgi:macrolide-specific efflux system membrane fusion protein
MKKKMQLNWRYIIVAVIVVVGCVSIYLALTWRADQPSYDYLQADRGEMRVDLRESGVVEPEHKLEITPPIPGRIDQILVANGTYVKQGQVLAVMSSTDRAALIDAARATSAKEYAFWQKVYKPAPLLAPLDGRIISTGVVPGEVVVTAQTVFTMSDHLIVQADVDETDLDQIWVGQKVDITFEGFPDARLTGTVHEIAQDSTTVNNVTTYQVNIFFDQTPSFVVSGLSTNLWFHVSQRENVLRVPTDAITPEGNVLIVRAPDTEPAVQPVQVGVTDGTYTEIVSGVKEGDWIARQRFALERLNNVGFSFGAPHVSGRPKGHGT